MQRTKTNNSADYNTCKDIVSKLSIFNNITVTVDVQSRFRKYIYEIGLKAGKEFRTNKLDEDTIIVTRIK